MNHAMYFKSEYIGLTGNDDGRVDAILRNPTGVALKSVSLVGPVLSVDDRGGALAIPHLTFAETHEKLTLAKFLGRKVNGLRQWRKNLGMSQEQAAAWVGVSRRAYQNYEAGTRSLPAEVVHTITQ